MSFEEKIKEFTEDLSEKIKHIKTEDGTINALINPFLGLLGYDVTDPKEVEYQYDVAIELGVKKLNKKGKIDIVILNDINKPKIIVECKKIKKELSKEHIEQLKSYYNITPNCRVGILTDGIVYKFFTNTDKLMDKEPFIEINLTKLTDEDISDLEMFKKEKYNPKNIVPYAKEKQYNKKIKKLLEKEFERPSDDFVRLFAKKVDKGVMNKNKIKKYRKIIKNNLKIIIDEKQHVIKPLINNHKGFSEEEFNRMVGNIKKLPDKLKNDKWLENPSIIKISKIGDEWETPEYKNSFYVVDTASNAEKSFYERYFNEYTGDYVDELVKTGVLKAKYPNHLKINANSMFIRYFIYKKPSSKEKMVLDNIFKN